MSAPHNFLPERSPEGWEKGFIAILALGFLGLMGVNLMEDYEPRKLAIVFTILFWIPLLILHEFGHAVVARLCGWEVDGVVIGFGRTIARFNWSGTAVELKMVPLSGYVLPRPRNLRSPRLKNALIYAGGPGIELLAGLLVIAWLGPDVVFHRSEAMGVIAAQSFCVAAAIGLVFTLVPYNVESDSGGYVWSDGLGILMSAKLPDTYFQSRIRPPAGDESDED
ncbi:MAG: rseP [Verrucomicrobiales bacterium]|nr:rseP [Verrucomicrobiales bacterium]